MNIFRINTTAWKEEDLIIKTSLNIKQVFETIEPIVKNERENEIYYDNLDLYFALKNKYSNEYVEIINIDAIETITI